MDLNEKLKYVSSYTSKLIRRKFGRGPESCFAVTNNYYLILYIRGFISPMEEVLLQQQQRVSVEHARSVIIKSIQEELKGVIQVTLEAEVETFYDDWNFPNNSGMIVAVLNDKLLDHPNDSIINYQLLEKEVARLSELVQKVPEEIIINQITPKMYVVIRKGILIPIEKALIAKGFKAELQVTKDELEKSYFHRDGSFDTIFHSAISDILIDWDLKGDKSILLFVLK